MGVVRRVALVLGLWLLTFVAQAAPAEVSPTVTVYFSERPPFTLVEGQGGILLAVTKAVLADAGVRGRFIELPASRIIEALRTGPPDALGVGLIKTPEREAWGRYSPSLYQDRGLVAVVNQRAAGLLPSPCRLDALLTSGLALGRTAGTSFGALVDQKIRAFGLVPLETVVDTRGLLRQIAQGRLDYTLVSEEEAQTLVPRDDGQGPLVVIRFVDPPPANHRYFLYPATIAPDLAARIDQALERFKATSRYRALTTLEGSP